MGAGDEADARPLLLAEEPSSSGDISPLLASLRLFSCGQVDDSAFPPGAEEGELLPALLHPYRNPERVRQDYPLFLAPGGERPCLPLSELLEELLKAAAPGAEEARVLKDNLARLERRVRDEIEPGIASVEARECLLRASRAMEEELELDVESAARLQGDTAAMLRGLPEGGRLLPLSEETFIPLLVHAARERLIGRWALFRAEIESLCGARQALLDLEDSQAPEAREARSLRESVGSAGAGRIDAEALASVLGPSRGSARMTPERRHRIEGVLETLRGGLESGEEPRVTIIHEGSLAATATDLGEDPGVDPLACWRGVEAEAPCARAAELFDEEAARHASLCAAVRVAKLEVAGGFDPERHQPFLTAFNWEAFSREELLLMSPLVAIAPVESLAGDGMAELSSLIRSGRPVKVLVAVQPAVNPGAGEDPAAGCRFELGYLGISHREALVVQSSAARPEHLVTGFLRAMDATRVTLLVTSTGLTAGGERPRVGSWLEVGAALEGRAHPFFIYDPEAGRTWARRMEFTGNPHPELDWPLYDLEYRAEGRRAETLSLAFTFADYALLEPSCSHHFRAIPPGCPAGDLLDLADYLDLDG
ncbi:MAG: hypothetical protein ACE5GW_03870, partial [Planctomycetota bacterium]